jgi:hypothetical protein
MTSGVEMQMSSIGTIHFVAMVFIVLNENRVELHIARVRDSSGALFS